MSATTSATQDKTKAKHVKFSLPMQPVAKEAASTHELLRRACDRRRRLLLRFKQRLDESAADLMALWTPVSLSLLTACLMTLIRQSGRADDEEARVALEPEVSLVITESTTGLRGWQLILIASLSALLIIVLMSFVMVALLKFSCFACLKGYVCLAFLVLACHSLCFWFYTASNALSVPVDWITTVIVSYNFLALVILAIGAGDSVPKRLVQLVHILLSATVAYVISAVVLQGSFAYAALLCSLFSAWDLFAVLCPRGPLNSLIKLAEREDRVTGFMQPLVYTAAVWNVVTAEAQDPGPDAGREDAATASASGKPRRPKRGSRLGLGDFIFYGVLASSAVSESGILGAVACYAGLSVGFYLTLVALKLLDRALPALPLPVLAAIVPVALVTSAGVPFSDAMADRQLML